MPKKRVAPDALIEAQVVDVYHFSAAASASERIRTLMGHQGRYSPRQEEILDILEEAFLELGLRSVTIGELVRRSRCSRATLYELAATKELLFLLVVDRLWRRAGERAREQLLNAPNPVAGLEVFLRESMPLFQPPSPLAEAIATYGPARRLLDDHLAIALDLIAGVVATGIREGEFLPFPPRVTAEVALAVTQLAGRERSGTEESALEEVIDILLYGMMAADPAQQSPTSFAASLGPTK